MGSYVDDNLMPGERIVHEARVHWGIYGFTAVLGVGALYPAVNMPEIGILFFIPAVLFGLLASIERSSTELVITDCRIIAKFGFVRRRTFEKHIDRLEGINFDQGVLGRILGYGTITVGGLGGGGVPVPFIANPQHFKRRLYEVIDYVQRKPKA